MADNDLISRDDDTDGIDDMPEVTDDDLLAGPVPFWAVLAPEGVWSGDKRRFADNGLTHRDLPIPLQWQKSSGDGHSGSVVVGHLDTITREDNLLIGEGVFADTDDADDVIGLIGDGHLRGISVDVDSAEIVFADDPDDEDADGVTFSRGRISGATIVPIPAFAEAVIRLGTRADHEALTAALEAFRDYDAEQRKRMAEKGQALPDGSYPIVDEEDLRNAIQAIGRAKDPESAKRHIMKRARALGLTDLIPAEWAGSTDEFARGPGWVTNPAETRRLHAYWTRGKGAAKIKWGASGDFTRCTRYLRRYIGPAFLNRTCAQWHHDALGYWPGELGKPGNPPDTPENRRRAARHASLSGCDDCDTAGIGVVTAAAPPEPLPARMFANPGLDAPTPITVTDDGHVFGHIAPWDECHVGVKGVCTVAPRSMTSYGCFASGVVATDAGDVHVGQITMETGHADTDTLLSWATAKAHYDDTGTAVADIAVGEDEHGIWFSGMLRDDVTPAQWRALRAAKLSGDWREYRGNLELVGVLAVNVPGFPIPRTRVTVASGRQVVLVAATGPDRQQPQSVAIGDIAAAVVTEMEARQDARRRAADVTAAVTAMRLERISSVRMHEEQA